MVRVTRVPIQLNPDPQRLVLRPFLPGAASFGEGRSRPDQIVQRAFELPRIEVESVLSQLRARHLPRFPDIETTWESNFELATSIVEALKEVDDGSLRQLIGALFTQAYAYEGAALTNPSMVPIEDPIGDMQRFVMSARAIGEGHISSIAFLTGTVDGRGEVTLDERSSTSTNGQRRRPHYSRQAFAGKLKELDFLTPAAMKILGLVGEVFTAGELTAALDLAPDSDLDPLSVEEAVMRMHWLADSNYEVGFDEKVPLSARVISPAAPVESRGMEDARFVRFVDEDGSTTYYATYTAYDGVRILPQLIETADFSRFRMATMTGPAVHHKGMALFPRKINDEYVALSRHDQERSFILRSDDVRSWASAEVVFGPTSDWDLIQTGNCGAPIETDDGWLVITHGVGPMRRYVLGALLLDLDEPTKVIARLREPLIEPEDDETFGYVPDVVYSCGSMIHAGNLIIPYGFADSGIKIGVTALSDLIGSMS